MKKFLILLLVVFLVMGSLVACSSQQGSGEGEEPEGNGEKEDTPGELKKVTYVFPRTLEVLEDTPFWVAKNLGYWEEEGLDVTLDQAFGTTDIKMVATGAADFAGPGTSIILAGIEEGLPIKVVSAYDSINIWGMCVPKDSKVQSWDDMKDAQGKYGKKLTVALGDAAWEMLVAPTIEAAGVDLEKDIEFVVAGENRYIQVDEGKIDMLFTWPGEAWQLMGQGFEFNYIDGNDVLKTCSNSIVANTKMIEEDPEVIEGFVRGLAKGMLFTKLNPEAGAAVVCKQFPAIDVTWKAATFVQMGRAYQMFGPEGGEEEATLLEKIGFLFEDKWKLVMDTTVSSGVIKEAIPLDKVITNDFVDLTWDRKQVEEDAKNYDIDSVKSKYKAE